MDRGVWRIGGAGLALLCLILVWCGPLRAQTALPPPATELAVARWTGAEEPALWQVLSGAAASGFAEVEDGRLVPTARREVGWWRLVALRDIAPHNAPQLVLTPPHRKRVELWRPGDSEPLARAIYGRDADYSHSTRFLVFPLPQGLRRGDALYLRMIAADVVPAQVSILPGQEVYRGDIVYVAVRTFVLTVLGLIALLAFGLWIGLRERGYVFLGLTLATQMLAMAIEGGEMRAWLELGPLALDRRMDIILNTAAVVASLRFFSLFLRLRDLQPTAARLLDGCCVLLGGLIAVTIFKTWRYSGSFGNLVLLAAIAVVLYAIGAAVWRRQREGVFLLVAWSPLIVSLVALVGAYQRWWPMYRWLEFAYPSSLAFSGLALLFGLTSRLRQLRHDRDRAQHRASYDALTGVLARTALEEALAAAVGRAQRSGEALSVLFLDIDHFKRINDEHGHRAGDEALRIVALRARNRLRPGDLCGRYGGDEMVAVLIGARLDEALRVAEHMRLALNDHPLSIEGRLIPIALSLGVAELRPGESGEQLLRRADAALYASKSAGRDRVTADRAALGAVPAAGAA
ncbi:diguanylate cyclase [Lysobacter firmicutimachus]|uniref:diguanylate cyclase n=1 Tax=Lysobacter firmicutimachus TaxID=1792846 RepID=A0ABU8D357_9GAMM